MILGFDTATPRVTVALWEEGTVFAQRDSDGVAQRHGELLAPLISAVLAEARVSVGDLSRIAVGVGPGPFTGLRIGVVTARALGWSLGIPVVGVCTLDVIAASVGEQDFAVATDARRKEVYFARYRNGRRVDEPVVVKPEVVAMDDLVVGPGGVLYASHFSNALDRYPDAGLLCRLVGMGGVRSLDPEPMYLRRPDAVVPGTAKRVS